MFGHLFLYQFSQYFFLIGNLLDTHVMFIEFCFQEPVLEKISKRLLTYHIFRCYMYKLYSTETFWKKNHIINSMWETL